MVRKPELVPKPLSQAVYNPPYPVSPDEAQPPNFPPPSTSPTFDVVTHEEASRSRSNSNASSSDWSHFDDEEKEEAKDVLPNSLQPGRGMQPAGKTDETSLPPTLRVGPPGGKRAPTIITSSDSPQSPEPPAQSPLLSNNPYLKMQSTGQSNFGGEDTNAIWSNNPASVPTYGSAAQEPIEMPLDNTTPVEQVSKLSLKDDAPASPQAPPLRAPPAQPAGNNAPSGETTERPLSSASSIWNPGMDISSLDALTSRSHGLPSDIGDSTNESRTWQEQQAWEKSERERREREAAEAYERAAREEAERRAEEEWYKGEQAAAQAAQAAQKEEQIVPEQKPTPPVPEQATPVLEQALPIRAQTAPVKESPAPEAQAPELPPRRSLDGDQAPPKPPRAQTDLDAVRSEVISPPRTETPRTRQQRQRKENYQIKHIRWFDSRTDTLREAPILTQNANGPCPLLALVNALVLSTRAKDQSVLVETLRTREQVSLGLLLDAVFDELMSGRRGGAAQELPDVGDLYAFLLALHTGMNVNPKFVAQHDTSVPGSPAKPGGFEETREMRLYSTFNVPLIHGWMPPSESRAYAAFERSAKTYEDAQNIQFHEEELEGKLSTSGLTQQEQDLYEDLQVIKEFLQRWPTQLTDFGLNTTKNNLKSGEFAILFRNDHFSTIYKEPQSQRILTLVTDAGYSSHEEIVWESLVDVTGRNSELFSGDFRPVSHHADVTGGASDAQIRNIADPPIRSLLDLDNNQGWQTVPQRNQRQSSGPGAFQSPAGITSPQRTGTISSPTTGNTEQEDADLALALQLQEEEEDRARREQEDRRRRENELSQTFIAQESHGGRGNRTSSQSLPPAIPPRRNNAAVAAAAANTTHRPANAGDEPPPPTYEQAAQRPAYNPPEGHPASQFSPVVAQGQGPQGAQGLPALPARPAAGSVGAATGRGGGRIGAGPGRRASHGPGGMGGQGRDERCVVM
ncbi:uncharacterized protein K452DRAFT_286424 [Aplosporella prunicola CBS 121167]|uniref:MINDY deubiquitinase domain-containing protein n=1 Tax=Aplosporella prunicola CBS 121167 TaxID=1176127 RepID=A0A6A6BIY9_9PEZI|nr:uncharacterized protein K452DRAFT_286424 [Aplosporella prunicola CBS 121167]KAF2142797.1 hypothetical protein K452DRAFT_286424 [Aplosporella prunicola CBS 121167]